MNIQVFKFTPRNSIHARCMEEYLLSKSGPPAAIKAEPFRTVKRDKSRAASERETERRKRWKERAVAYLKEHRTILTMVKVCEIIQGGDNAARRVIRELARDKLVKTRVVNVPNKSRSGGATRATLIEWVGE